jgi:hypothetical protein
MGWLLPPRVPLFGRLKPGSITSMASRTLTENRTLRRRAPKEPVPRGPHGRGLRVVLPALARDRVFGPRGCPVCWAVGVREAWICALGGARSVPLWLTCGRSVRARARPRCMSCGRRRGFAVDRASQLGARQGRSGGTEQVAAERIAAGQAQLDLDVSQVGSCAGASSRGRPRFPGHATGPAEPGPVWYRGLAAVERAEVVRVIRVPAGRQWPCRAMGVEGDAARQTAARNA